MIDKIAVWEALLKADPDFTQLSIIDISKVVYKEVTEAKEYLISRIKIQLCRASVMHILEAEFHQDKYLNLETVPRVRNSFGIEVEIWPRKFAEVKPYLRWFRNNGFTRKFGPRKDMLRPNWNFYHEELNASCNFYANFESNTGDACQLIQVGTKLTETPIMKMLCGEELDTHNRLEAS